MDEKDYNERSKQIYQNLVNKINQLYEQLQWMEKNSFETKISVRAFCVLLPLLLLATTQILGVVIIPPVGIITSLITGTALYELLTRKKAPESKKLPLPGHYLEEETRTLVEAKKLESRKLIMEKEKEKTESYRRIGIEIGIPLTNNKVNSSEYIKEEMQKKKEKIDQLYQELDVLTTQEALSEKYRRMNFIDTIMLPMVGGTFIAVAISGIFMPSALLTTLTTFVSDFYLGTVTTGFGVGLWYGITSMKTKWETFTKLNGELKEHALDPKSMNHQKELDDRKKKWNDRMEQICEMQLVLHAQEQYLSQIEEAESSMEKTDTFVPKRKEMVSEKGKTLVKTRKN